jgi:hypothetical protein
MDAFPDACAFHAGAVRTLSMPSAMFDLFGEILFNFV